MATLKKIHRDTLTVVLADPGQHTADYADALGVSVGCARGRLNKLAKLGLVDRTVDVGNASNPGLIRHCWDAQLSAETVDALGLCGLRYGPALALLEAVNAYNADAVVTSWIIGTEAEIAQQGSAGFLRQARNRGGLDALALLELWPGALEELEDYLRPTLSTDGRKVSAKPIPKVSPTRSVVQPATARVPRVGPLMSDGRFDSRGPRWGHAMDPAPELADCPHPKGTELCTRCGLGVASVSVIPDPVLKGFGVVVKPETSRQLHKRKARQRAARRKADTAGLLRHMIRCVIEAYQAEQNGGTGLRYWNDKACEFGGELSQALAEGAPEPDWRDACWALLWGCPEPDIV